MINGACHCQAVKWSYDLPLESATACNCTLCRRYGALWAYGHLEHGIQVSGVTEFYERGSKHNGFYFCPTCACITHYLSHKADAEGKRRMAVNLRMALEPEKIQHLLIDHFEGLVTFEDLPRDGRCIKDLWF